MDFYIKIISLFLLWACKCRSTPTPNGVSPPNHLRINSGWSQNRNSSSGGSGTRVVYPAHISNSHRSENKTTDVLQTRLGPVLPELPSSCHNNERFCNATNYPKEHVERLLQKSELVRQGVFSADESEPKELEGDLGNRQGGVDIGTPLCLSVVDSKPANTGVDKDGKQRFIINHENVTQHIRREKCESVDSPCKLDTFPNNYVVRCRQKFTERKLAALNDQNEIEWMFFPTPSCCVCSYYSKRVSRSIFTPANNSKPHN